MGGKSYNIHYLILSIFSSPFISTMYRYFKEKLIFLINFVFRTQYLRWFCLGKSIWKLSILLQQTQTCRKNFIIYTIALPYVWQTTCLLSHLIRLAFKAVFWQRGMSQGSSLWWICTTLLLWKVLIAVHLRLQSGEPWRTFLEHRCRLKWEGFGNGNILIALFFDVQESCSPCDSEERNHPG